MILRICFLLLFGQGKALAAAIVCTFAFLLRVLARDPSPYAKFLRNVQVLVVDEANATCLTDFRAYRRC